MGPDDVTVSDAAVDVASLPPVPVAFPREILDHGMRTSPQAAGFGAWNAYSLAGTERAFPVLPFDDARARAVIVVAEPAGAPAASVNAPAIVATTPPAATVLATATLPAGTYTVSSELILAGTLAAADRNNVGLYVGSTLVYTFNNGINTGTVYTQPPVAIVVPPGGAVVTLQAIALATTGAVYSASFNAAGASSGFVYVGSEAQCKASPPLGGQLPAGAVVELRNQQPLWMVPDGDHPMVVSVLAERYEVNARSGG